MKKGLLVVLILGALALAYWLGNQQGQAQAPADGALTIKRASEVTQPDSPNDSANSEAQETTEAASTGDDNDTPQAASDTWVNQPLPAEDLPLAATFDQLKAQALAGNKRASCRLAKELMDCHNQAARKNTSNFLMAVAQNESIASNTNVVVDTSRGSDDKNNKPDPMIDILAKQAEDIDRATKRCEGLSDDQVGQTYDMQRLAAQQGIADIQAAYLMRPALSRQRYLDDMAGWQDYRQHAPQVAQALLEQGRAEAVDWLAQAYSLGTSMISKVPFLLKDEDKALAYALLRQQLNPNIGPGHPLYSSLPENLSAEAKQAAENRAFALKERFFSGYEPKSGQSSITRGKEIDCSGL